MPFYDYKCAKCSSVFEIEKGMKEKPVGLRCPRCGGSEVNRVFTRPRILRGEVAILNDMGSSGSGSDCNTCTDGACSCCGSKK